MMPRAMFLPLFVAFAGCDRGSSSPPPKAEEKEEETAQVTVWGERFEIFLEHKPIVAHRPTAFVTHVTDLKTLHPRREGKIAFVLTPVGGPEIVHVEEAPKRPGIYVPDLKFPEVGEWTVALRIPVDGAEVVEILPHVHVHKSAEDAGAGHGHEHASAEGITFLKEQQWKVLTKSEPVAKRRLVDRVRVPAAVAVRPGSRALVAPPVAGRILAPAGRALPRIGEKVEAGQTLALVQPPFSDFAAKIVEANAEAIRAKLVLDQAELSLARVKKLAAGGAKTERELQEAEFAVKSAQAAYEAAAALKATYERGGAVFVDRGSPALELKAPISGTVTSVSAAVGEHAAADRAVFTLLDTGTVFVEARVPEGDLDRVQAAKAAHCELASSRGSFLPIGERTRLVHVSSEVDLATRTVAILYEVANPDGKLRIGTALTLHLEAGRGGEALAIPASAVVEEEARPIAFVQVSGETFQKRSLTLGLRDGEWIQVLAGLEEGERVVTKEAFAIRLASVSSVIPAHGHAH